MTRYTLVYYERDDDRQPVPNAPEGFSLADGREYLRRCRVAFRRAGWTPVTQDPDGSFYAVKGTRKVWVRVEQADERPVERAG